MYPRMVFLTPGHGLSHEIRPELRKGGRSRGGEVRFPFTIVRRSRLQSPQLLQQFLAFRYGARRAHYSVPYDAVLIDDECRAPVHAAFFVEDAVSLADRSMGPVIREQRKRHAAKLFRPRFQARDGVRAELQDLDVECFELIVVLTEPFDLIRSSAGKGKRHECHHHPAAPKAAQRERLSRMGCQRKFRRLSACLKCCHVSSPRMKSNENAGRGKNTTVSVRSAATA